jgi:broad specificity phosphatase PhoE
VRLYVFARHAQSVLNLERRINGDPSVAAPLTEQGREEARLLGLQTTHVPLERCVHTRFERTRVTAELALADRDVAFECEPLLDDIDVGDLEGKTIDDYRAWKKQHQRSDPFPGGESLDNAARRYVEAFELLVHSDAAATLVVCHEIPIRYALNAAAGSSDLDGPVHAIPNAAPFLFDEHALQRAAERIRELVRARGVEPPRGASPTGT